MRRRAARWGDGRPRQRRQTRPRRPAAGLSALALLSLLLRSARAEGVLTNARTRPPPAPPPQASGGAVGGVQDGQFLGTEATCASAIEIDAVPDCNCSACTVFGSTWLQDKCCSPALRGISVNILAFERDKLWVPRIQEFSSCVGARVSVTYNRGGEEKMEEDLRQDVGAEYIVDDAAVKKTEGAGIYDAYVVQAPWLPAVQQGLENLSPWVAKTPELDWLDINSMSRQTTSFNNTIRALPLDVDYIAFGWREDVFEAHNKTPPETLEEMVELSEYFNGKDHNDDGQSDWGFCLTVQPNYLMAFVAPILQTQQRKCRPDSNHNQIACDGDHTGQNLFFDVSNMEPLIANDGFQHAVKLFRRFVLASNCQEQLLNASSSDEVQNHCDRFAAVRSGRCAGVISMPGTMTRLLKPWDQGGDYAPQPRRDAAGRIIWEPAAKDGGTWGRRLRFPGSTHVFDWARGELRECDQKLCPKAIPHSKTGRLVNYSPFFAEGGESYAIRASVAPQKKEVLWQLFTWFSTLPPSILPLTGVYRESYIRDPKVKNDIEKAGWPKQMVDDLMEVLRFYFLEAEDPNPRGEVGNAAMDLLLIGFSEYMDELNRFLLKDFIIHPDLFFAENKPQEFPQEKYLEQASKLYESYDLITQRYGRLEQVARWRASLNMPYMSERELCQQFKQRMKPRECVVYEFDGPPWAYALLLPVGGVALMAVSVLLCTMVARLKARCRRHRELEAKRQREFQESILAAEGQLDTLGHPMVLVKAADFLDLGRLLPYEQLRDQGKLVYLDSQQKTFEFKEDRFIVFMSHQWLGWGDPDPNMVHYEAMSGAIHDIVTRVGRISSLKVDKAGAWKAVPGGKECLDATVDNLYVWCDYISIAQEHRPTQVMAVSSLPMYSSIADVFVIVAPPATHMDSGMPCDINTYNSRGWCRAEMLSKVCGTGLSQMYVTTSPVGVMEKVTEEWLDRLDLKVFSGEFSCCHLGHRGSSICDKESLVRPCLGLYALILRSDGYYGGNAILSYIQESKSAFFPEYFTFNSHEGWQEQRELFGPLVEQMEEHVQASCESQMSLRTYGRTRLTTSRSEGNISHCRSCITEAHDDTSDSGSTSSQEKRTLSQDLSGVCRHAVDGDVEWGFAAFSRSETRSN